MLKLGYNCSGTEKVFEKILREQIALALSLCEPFIYAEIGIAEGTTIKAVADVCLEYSKDQEDGCLAWNAIGIDLFGGAFFNSQNFLAQVPNHNVEIDHSHYTTIASNFDYISVYLMAEGMTVEDCIFEESIHFAVIDGCHGAPCVERDFLAIEPAIAKGGIVAFHDAMPEDQYRDYQAHCGTPINVRHAITDILHLPVGHPSIGPVRTGWEWIGDVHGDKSANPPGNGFAFFRKV